MDVELIKEYIEDNDVSLDNLNLDNAEEQEEIKSNPIKLSEYYIKYFNEFSKAFRNCHFKEVKSFLSKKEIFIYLIKLSSYKTNSSEFGKSYMEKRLVDYVLNNYDEIVGFFDFYLEVCE